MGKRYVSVDVEASGPVPGMYDMLSLGACFVDDPSITFYRELKPLHQHRYDEEAMKIAGLGFKDIRKISPSYDPLNSDFAPELVMYALSEYGSKPSMAMLDFSEWVNEHANGDEPVLLTDVQPFDGSFVMWYFNKLLSRKFNPFSHKGVNIDALYMGITGDMNANVKKLGIEDDRETPHNALDDAVFQAKLARKVFSLMK